MEKKKNEKNTKREKSYKERQKNAVNVMQTPKKRVMHAI